MKSIIQENKECYLCRRIYDFENTQGLEEHHIFGGANRNHSEHYGLKVWLCHNHHNEYPNGVHRNKEMRILIRQLGQREFEKMHSREEFMQIFGKNYLED